MKTLIPIAIVLLFTGLFCFKEASSLGTRIQEDKEALYKDCVQQSDYVDDSICNCALQYDLPEYCKDILGYK